MSQPDRKRRACRDCRHCVVYAWYGSDGDNPPLNKWYISPDGVSPVGRSGVKRENLVCKHPALERFDTVLGASSHPKCIEVRDSGNVFAPGCFSTSKDVTLDRWEARDDA